MKYNKIESCYKQHVYNRTHKNHFALYCQIKRNISKHLKSENIKVKVTIMMKYDKIVNGYQRHTEDKTHQNNFTKFAH